MRRFAHVIRMIAEYLPEYQRLHANAWPEVLAMIRACNIQNNSIYHKDGFLFAYFEYTGDDYQADMASMASDSHTQSWWELTMPMQAPLESRSPGEGWASMEEVFRLI